MPSGDSRLFRDAVWLGSSLLVAITIWEAYAVIRINSSIQLHSRPFSYGVLDASDQRGRSDDLHRDGRRSSDSFRTHSGHRKACSARERQVHPNWLFFAYTPSSS